MSEALKIAMMNLIARVGLDLAIDLLSGLNKSATIEEAIAALQKSQQKTWADYKREA